jgi:hypothetical protein
MGYGQIIERKVAQGDLLRMIRKQQRVLAAMRQEIRFRQPYLQRQGTRGVGRVKLGLTIPPWTPPGYSD